MTDVITIQIPGIQGVQGPAGPGGAAFNVRNAPYNAKGDGANDDTVGIQAAITAVKNAATAAKSYVYLPFGFYKITATLEVPDYVSIIADWGTVINQTSSTLPVMRIAAFQNYISNLTLQGGKYGLALYGTSLVYGGTLGHVTSDTTCVFDNLSFNTISGVAVFMDSSVFSNGQLIFNNLTGRVKSLWFGATVALVLNKAEIFFDVSGGTVNDSLGRPLSLINSAQAVYTNDFLVVPSGTSAYQISHVQGTGVFDLKSTRFGGEDICCAVRVRKAITYSGVTMPVQSWERPTISLVDCQLSGSSSRNWLEVEADFPALIHVENTLPVYDTSYYNSGSQTYGIWVDNSVNMDTVAGYDASACQINFRGHPVLNFFTCRQSSDRTQYSGTPVDLQILDRSNLPSSNYGLVQQNVFNSGVIDLSGFSTIVTTSLSAASADTSSGWSISGFTSSAASALGVWNLSIGSGVAAGVYTLSFWVKSTKQFPIYWALGSSLGSKYRTPWVVNNSNQWQRYSVQFYHTGSAKAFELDAVQIQNSTTFYIGFFSLTAGTFPCDWTYPGNPAPVAQMRAQYYGTAAPVSGTYIVGDILWHTSPAASGNIGWVCTTGGSPGTWKAFGTIAA